jgi:MFS family permease
VINRNLILLAVCQGLFLTNNITFIAINGLVGFSLAPFSWMATLPVMGYVVGGALSTVPVSRIQERFGRKPSFLIGICVAILSSLLCLLAATTKNFALLVTATLIAGFYQANGHLYRFAAAELAGPDGKERAVSWVLTGGILGAIAGPNIAAATKDVFAVPFAGAYLSLTLVGCIAAGVMSLIQFPPLVATKPTADEAPRPLREIVRQPLFLLATLGAALGYGVMNLLMAATPLAMQTCGFPFKDAALVLEWHVIGMFAPGFFTGHLIQRYGALPIMAVGVGLNVLCIGIALTGVELHQFLIALFVLGVGWNFLFTASTTLSLKTYRPSEKDRAQATINLAVFSTMVLTSFGSGALVTTQGWSLLNLGSLIPMGLMAMALVWAALRLRGH